MKYVIALGANLGDRQKTLDSALRRIEETIAPIVRCSSFIETPALVPVGEDPTQHPAYLNAAILLESDTEPETVLAQLLSLEKELGRERGVTEKRWQPRTIDLDIIAIDSLVLHSTTLSIPHPEMHKRLFVLDPLCEIWPEWVHPILKSSAKELHDRIS